MSNGSVIVDPEHVKSFAQALNNTARKLKQEQSALRTSHGQLSEKWRDQRYQQFDRVFQDATRRLDAFHKRAEAYATYLMRKAHAADAYLRGGR